jgi:hypothetical protein
VKGTLLNYRYDLILEMTPDERMALIALIRAGLQNIRQKGLVGNEFVSKVGEGLLDALGVTS